MKTRSINTAVVFALVFSKCDKNISASFEVSNYIFYVFIAFVFQNSMHLEAFIYLHVRHVHVQSLFFWIVIISVDFWLMVIFSEYIMLFNQLDFIFF